MVKEKVFKRNLAVYFGIALLINNFVFVILLSAMRMFVLFCFLALLSVVYPNKVDALEFNSVPERIIIPSVNISLPVYTAPIAYSDGTNSVYSDGTNSVYNSWEVGTDGAYFGQTSALPGRIGNTVIFAHAFPTMFGFLPNVRQGELIHVFTDKDWFVYKAQEVLVVNPQNIEILQNLSFRGLTLYTCTGRAWQKRFVIKAEGLVGLDRSI